MQASTRRHSAPMPRTGLRRLLGSITLAERLLFAGVAAVLLLVGLSNVNGTYAMWVDEASVEGTTLTTGTAALSAHWVDSEQESAWKNLLPGESSDREAILENTGTVPLEVTMSLDSSAPGFALASPTPLVIEPGRTATLTVDLTATEDLHPGDEIALEIHLEGTQTR